MSSFIQITCIIVNFENIMLLLRSCHRQNKHTHASCIKSIFECEVPNNNPMGSENIEDNF